MNKARFLIFLCFAFSLAQNTTLDCITGCLCKKINSDTIFVIQSSCPFDRNETEECTFYGCWCLDENNLLSDEDVCFQDFNSQTDFRCVASGSPCLCRGDADSCGVCDGDESTCHYNQNNDSLFYIILISIFIVVIALSVLYYRRNIYHKRKFKSLGGADFIRLQANDFQDDEQERMISNEDTSQVISEETFGDINDQFSSYNKL